WLIDLVHPCVRFDLFHGDRHRFLAVVQNGHHSPRDFLSEFGFLLFRFTGPKFYDDMRHCSLLSKQPVKSTRSAIAKPPSAISALTRNAASRPNRLATRPSVGLPKPSATSRKTV